MTAFMQVCCYGKSDAQQQQVRVVADRQLAEQAAAGVPGALEERLVCLFKGWVVFYLLFRQGVNARGTNVRNVNA